MRLKKRYGFIWQSRQHGKRRLWGFLFLLPSLAGVAGLVLLPFGDVVRRSFYTSLSGEYVGLANYKNVLDNAAFRLSAVNTLRFLGTCLPLLLGGSLAFALILWKHPRWEPWKTCYLLPMAMPAATVVLVWRLLFAKQGFLNEFAGTQIEFMAQDSAFWILVGSYLWKNMGYTLILWLAGLKAIPAELTEAARVDGAGGLQQFLYVTLPGLKGAFFTIFVLSFLNAFKVFREAYLVSGAYPQETIYLLQHLFNNWYANLELDKMAAGAVLLAILLGAVSFLMGRLLEDGTVQEV